jgi:NO-binding membrane sensor protein with MHYT domain
MAVDINLLDMFLSILVLAFGIFSIIAGAFTAYFGTGRSRSIGGALIILGIIGFIILMWFTGMFGSSVSQPLKWDTSMVIAGFVAVIGALVGALVALGIFLVAIMKS